jgi:hypothetical protein
MQFSTLAATVLSLVVLATAQTQCTTCLTLNGGKLGQTTLVACPTNFRCDITSSGNTGSLVPGGTFFYDLGVRAFLNTFIGAY